MEPRATTAQPPHFLNKETARMEGKEQLRQKGLGGLKLYAGLHKGLSEEFHKGGRSDEIYSREMCLMAAKELARTEAQLRNYKPSVAT